VAETIQDPEVDDETYLAGRRAKAYGKLRGKNPWRNVVPPTSRRVALKAVGPVLYALRLNDGVIKIGFTTNLARRIDEFDEQPEVLAIKAGTRDDETALHLSLASHVHHGHEWYNPTPVVMAVVNHWRTGLGLAII
jgi:hypothetical protein